MAYPSKNPDKEFLVQPPSYESQECNNNNNNNNNNNTGMPLQARKDPQSLQATDMTLNAASSMENQVNIQFKNSCK